MSDVLKQYNNITYHRNIIHIQRKYITIERSYKELHNEIGRLVPAYAIVMFYINLLMNGRIYIFFCVILLKND